MRKIELTRIEKLRFFAVTSLILAFWLFNLGIALAASSGLGQDWPMPVVALFCALPGLYWTAIYGIRVYRDWIRGRIHTVVLVNSRRAVIVRRHARQIVIPREHIVATALGGSTLVCADGARYDLTGIWGIHAARQNADALDAIYATWWTDSRLDEVRSYFEQTGLPGFWEFLLYPALLAYVATGLYAYHVYGLTGLLPLLVIVLLHISINVGLAQRRSNRTLYYFARHHEVTAPNGLSEMNYAED